MKLNNIFNNLLTLVLLILVIYLATSTRMVTYGTKTILDYDPFWFYRHAVEIYNNNFKAPVWDILSYYPPGRPAEITGWAWTMAIFFKIFNIIAPKMSLVEIGKLSPVIMVGLSAVSAFLLGRVLTNKWGGLVVALFATLTPTFIGVSMAGYSDSDAVVVFYSFLSAYSIILAIQKRSIPFYILATVINLLFIFNWFFGWYVIFFFTLFIPTLFVFRILEDIIHERKLRFDLNKTLNELKPISIPILIILIAMNITGLLFDNIGTLKLFVELNLGFVKGEGLLVNISVAELQKVDILTKSGFFAVANRVGLAPILLTLIGLPILVVYKIYKKVEIHFAEVFLFLWVLLTFYMILNGVRFALQFSIATAAAAGYVVGNLINYLRRDIIGATIFGVITLLTIMFISDAMTMANASGGMEVSQNWLDALDWLKANADKDSLIVTWWDPGHIIAGYAGLKVHADGAHCGTLSCIPYNHNIRIQDMGRIFSISNEDEAISILKKYKALTPQQCDQAKQMYADIMPPNACDPVTEMYLIASSDLIGKYYWMSYFGTGTGRNFLQLRLTNYDQSQGVLVYENGVLTLVGRENKLIPVLNIPQQGIRNVVIKEIVYYEQGQERRYVLENVTNAIDGMVWVDPSFQIAFFMDPAIRDSIFVKLFFWNGQNLTKFKQVFANGEVKVYKVVL